MELRMGTSIWDGVPEEWKDKPEENEDTINVPEKEPSPSETEVPSREDDKTDKGDDGKSDAEGGIDKGDEKEKRLKEKEAKKAAKRELQKRKREEKKKEREAKKEKREQEKKEKKVEKAKRNQEKIDKKKYAEFEKKCKENKENSSEHAKLAYLIEKAGNKKDFIILGIAVFTVFSLIAAFVIIFTTTSRQHIYDLVNQGNYSLAYQEISELYEKGKNVDSVVYDFAIECARNSEYKRAVASLEFLSDKAENNKKFFDSLIEILLSHGKINRALDVMDYMQSHGSKLRQHSVELYDKYRDYF